MRDETMIDVEAEETASADEIFELDDVSNTKGGPGFVGDGQGGLWLTW
jgi:hypothetical protein